jgi:CRISPR/Cas system Type II protein with McrA/HNH and RuvC-like nuclease domain
VSLQQNPEALDAIAFAEKVLALLDQGAFTSTYKFAVLLGLMDLVVEQADKSGQLASMLTTRQLADKIIEVYWAHTVDYSPLKAVPKQNTHGQAEIVSKIENFRKKSQFSTLFKAKRQNEERYKSLLDGVEKKLIEMPLPRLQYFGQQEQRFIYDIAWDKSIGDNLKSVTAYQRQQESDFDNRINLAPKVADYLMALNGLLRPLIQRTWALQVARINQLEESKLEAFLFQNKRSAIAHFSEGLSEVQSNRCFYCGKPLGVSQKLKPEVDHFVPWARYPNDGLANLVVAHASCNLAKSDHVAAFNHYQSWKDRNEDTATLGSIEDMAAEAHWEVRLAESMNIAQTLYGRMEDSVELWVGTH